jgi:hypothetical protein
LTAHIARKVSAVGALWGLPGPRQWQRRTPIRPERTARANPRQPGDEQRQKCDADRHRGSPGEREEAAAAQTGDGRAKTGLRTLKVAGDDELLVVGIAPDMYGWSIWHYLTSFPQRSGEHTAGE